MSVKALISSLLDYRNVLELLNQQKLISFRTRSAFFFSFHFLLARRPNKNFKLPNISFLAPS